MIYRPDNSNVLKAFARLRGNQDFKVIIEYLDYCLVRTESDMARSVEEYKMRWHQGGAQDIQAILKLYEESKHL